MIKNKKIHTILKSWGESKRILPINNELLKNNVMSKIPTEYQEKHINKYSFMPWLSFSLTAVALMVVLVGSNTSIYSNKNYISSKQENLSFGRNSISVSSYTDQKTAEVYQDVYQPEPTLYMPKPTIPISDSREFIKTNYSASLNTRNVSNLENKIEIIIKGFGGRVDTSNSSEKYGYINFAIPKDKFVLLKNEIKDLVGEKFYIEQINSQNLLPEKITIEENQKQTEENLSDLKIERKKIVKNHNENVYQLENTIASINTQLSTLNTDYINASAELKTGIIYRINQLNTELINNKSKLSSENKKYQTNINNIDSQIGYTEDDLQYIKQQDKNLIENVATIDGTLSLKWISLWEMADTYTPGPLLMWTLLGLAICIHLWYRYLNKNLLEDLS